MKRGLITLSLTLILEVLILSSSAYSTTNLNTMNRVKEIVTQIRAGDLSKGAMLRQLDIEAVPVLIEYADDENDNVRYSVTMALGEMHDERAIPVLFERLDDKNHNVRRNAIDALYTYSREVLSKQSDETLLQLAKYAGKWDKNSYKAALLVGDLGNESNIEALRKILEEAKNIRGEMDDRVALVPRVKAACLKAIFKLGDEKATNEVRMSLRKDDVLSRRFGVECVEYAGKRDFIKDLIPLLDDKRDAVNIAPSGFKSYLRVRDIAVNAIANVLNVMFSFPVRKGNRYTDVQAEEVKMVLEKYKS